MNDSNNLSLLILRKLEEQIERADHLIALVPIDHLEWQPLPESFRVCDLLGHLLECLAGFCAALYAIDPQGLAHFTRLRELRVNHCCGVEEARERIQHYRACIKEGFAGLTDADLARRLPTVFIAEGEAALTILLGNLEHFINHKHQLFFYLKMLGVPVATADLYQFRSDS
ncbi:MAG: DinB family protein [Blastocatellia bacterium]